MLLHGRLGLRDLWVCRYVCVWGGGGGGEGWMSVVGIPVSVYLSLV